jgi:hypothetical protein
MIEDPGKEVKNKSSPVAIESTAKATLTGGT